ncbi:MAG: tRNA (guanosine(37)-N1)-methyltransferase TrmD [Patescibacteria group bacterium]|nr:tRNA (guanosine(37)-N1)-methyltransferase TrmD [Patescibacteria group bacterium]
MVRFDIITLFPEAFSYFNNSILKKAQEKKIIKINLINLRKFAKDKFQTTDDYSYGGGPGMVLKIEPIYSALKFAQKKSKLSPKITILTDVRGKKFNYQLIKKLINYKHFIIICGHYEGVDERVKKIIDLSLSIGPYILTGGELPAMVIVDAISRYLPGFLKNPLSLEDRRGEKLMSYPVYTRPAIFKTKEGKVLKVPKVLLSGNHKEILKWRLNKAKKLI